MKWIPNVLRSDRLELTTKDLKDLLDGKVLKDGAIVVRKHDPLDLRAFIAMIQKIEEATGVTPVSITLSQRDYEELEAAALAECTRGPVFDTIATGRGRILSVYGVTIRPEAG